VFVLALSTVVYRYLDDWSWVDAFYFSSVAVPTLEVDLRLLSLQMNAA
jgi:hypothetical protein